MVTSERKMNELISKQKAIDEIKEFQSQVTCDFSKDWLNGMDEGFDHSINVIELIETVEAIPVENIQKLFNAALEYRDRFKPFSEKWLVANDQAVGIRSVLDLRK